MKAAGGGIGLDSTGPTFAKGRDPSKQTVLRARRRKNKRPAAVLLQRASRGMNECALDVVTLDIDYQLHRAAGRHVGFDEQNPGGADGRRKVIREIDAAEVHH